MYSLGDCYVVGRKYFFFHVSLHCDYKVWFSFSSQFSWSKSNEYSDSLGTHSSCEVINLYVNRKKWQLMNRWNFTWRGASAPKVPIWLITSNRHYSYSPTPHPRTRPNYVTTKPVLDWIFFVKRNLFYKILLGDPDLGNVIFIPMATLFRPVSRRCDTTSQQCSQQGQQTSCHSRQDRGRRAGDGNPGMWMSATSTVHPMTFITL